MYVSVVDGAPLIVVAGAGWSSIISCVEERKWGFTLLLTISLLPVIHTGGRAKSGAVVVIADKAQRIRMYVVVCGK